MTQYSSPSNISETLYNLQRQINDLRTQPRLTSASIDRGGTQSSDYDGTGIGAPGSTGWFIGTDETTGVGYVHIQGREYSTTGIAGMIVKASSTVPTVGGASADFTYTSATITLTRGTWEIIACATVGNATTLDWGSVGVWNITTNALVAESIGTPGITNTGVAGYVQLLSRPVLVTVGASSTQFAPRINRNGGSAVGVTGAAGGPAGYIHALRVA